MEYWTEFRGAELIKKKGYYEVAVDIGNQRASLILMEGAIEGFERKHGRSTFSTRLLGVSAYFIRNGQRLQPDQFKKADHLVGTVHSLDNLEVRI